MLLLCCKFQTNFVKRGIVWNVSREKIMKLEDSWLTGNVVAHVGERDMDARNLHKAVRVTGLLSLHLSDQLK